MEQNTIFVVNLQGITLDENSKKQMEEEIKAIAMKYIAKVDLSKIVINNRLTQADINGLNLGGSFPLGIVIRNESGIGDASL